MGKKKSRRVYSLETKLEAIRLREEEGVLIMDRYSFESLYRDE